MVTDGWGNTPWGGVYVPGVTPGLVTDYGPSGWSNTDWEWATLPSTLQIIDPDDTTKILFDLNDTAAANSALYGSVYTDLLSDVDMGAPKLDGQALDTGRALGFNRSATADMKFKLRIHGSSYDNVRFAVSTLANYIADGCTMLWKPNGSSHTNIVEILPSTTPVLLHGQERGMFQATVMFDTPEGVELNLQRIGYIRRDALTPSANALVNPTMIRDSNSDGTPDGWTKISTPTLSVVAATESLHIVAGADGRGIGQQTGAASAAVGQTWTLSVEVKVTSGPALMQMFFENAGLGVISSVNTPLSSTTWARVSVTGTAPATTDRIEIWLTATGGASTFDVRNAQLERSATVTQFRVPAATMNVDPAATPYAQFMPVFNPSDAPAPCTIETAFPDSSSKIVEVDYALVSDRGVVGSRALSDFLNGPNYAQAEATGNGWTVTLGTATTNTADTNASGGNVARVTYTAGDASTPTRRVRWTRTTLLDALRGRWKVYARVQGTGRVPNNMQLRWGAGTVAGETNTAVVHDMTSVPVASAVNYVYIDLGDIELPRERNIAIGQLTLELWTWLDDPSLTPDFDIDHLTFVPTDDSAIATTPEGSQSQTKGSLLGVADRLGAPASDPVFSAGSATGGAMRLNAADEAAGWGSITNGQYTGVTNTIHVVEFDLTGHVGQGGSIAFLCEVANLTDNTIDASVGGTFLSSSRSTYRLVVVDVNAKKYQPRVRITSRGAPAYIDVSAVRVSSLPYVAQNGKVRTDPGSMPTRAAVEQLDSSGNLGLAMDATGTPFWLPPGLSLLYVNVFDVPTQGYNENKSDLTSGAKRTFTVTPTVYPRHWQ